jgi:hypothetical protein
LTSATEERAALALVRKGRYDVDVEIFRDGEIRVGLLSQVLPGDSFQKCSNIGQWFLCTSPIQISVFRDENNPTFLLKGLQITQAPPRPEREARLIGSDMPNDVPPPEPIDPIAHHKLMLTSEIGNLYTSQDVPGYDGVVDTARHRAKRENDAEDVDFTE